MRLLSPKYWPTWFLLALLRISIYLPWATQIWLGKHIGRLICRVSRKTRHTTWVNLSLCFPDLTESDKAQLIRRTFENTGIALFETANAWWTSDKRLQQHADILGLTHLQQALTQNRGVLLLGLHQSTLYLAGRFLRLQQTVSVVYRKQHNPVIHWIMLRMLKRYYPNAIARENLLAVRHALRKNEVVWYTPDVDPRDKASLFAPFFNIRAATVNIPSRFARKYAIPLLTLHHYRHRDNQRYSLIISGPITISEDDADNMTRINQLLAQFIQKYPEQYLWQYKRFKTRPAGQPNPYKLTTQKALEQIT